VPINRASVLSQALDAVEQHEARLLVWGIVDGFFGREELSRLIDPIIDKALEDGFSEFSTADEVISCLLDSKCLTEVENANGETGFRSRMAETVRLLFRLRQLFPKHARTSGGWQTAPTLVADFRFQRRRRQYPRRDISSIEVIARLQSVSNDPALIASVRAVLQPAGVGFSLSGFQVRAAERILRGIEKREPIGTIVCAGTGSGKTLAFYLPALASIAKNRIRNSDESAWVKVIALYPRIELLKDQLREVISRSLSLTENLPGDSRVSIRIGALFSETPTTAERCDWPTLGNDRVCPSLHCVNCNGELRWLGSDISVGRERLVCDACKFEIDGSIFPLTRASIAKIPPDILFTTTETLNRRLSDNSENHLFGVGPNALRPPELVLLDEVHTYEGRQGAQVAYLMRRWQRLAEHSLSFVGLSATLREAATFFASLCGAKPHLVEEIGPQSDEMESEGAEYLIALRGDPVSRAALLSTSIQATMLFERCLDPRTPNLQDSVSAGVFGQRTFVFTDDLDVTNRMYFDLLSAEGRNSFGRPDQVRSPNGGLAHLRREGTSMSRYRSGQDWRMCEELGHQLSTRLVVKRVSSQDRGVDATADVIVATAALEVGFDDPSVGAVLQHKAPRGMASFLQRKGRAGRTRGMRPWTAVVLSDYGRDRIAYQGYDVLFDPELPVRTLPLTNRYITRMQAVFATIDFLGQRLQDATKGSVWRDLSKPSKSGRTERLVKELRAILESPSATQRLQEYLRQALKVTSSDVSALLWEYPRALMTTVLPTALRRLSSGWSAYGRPGADYQIQNSPLPDFIPASLFADLNLAEVNIELPVAPATRADPNQAMTVFAALREFAPGRVSRRFGIHNRSERHWIASPAGTIGSAQLVALDVTTFGAYVPLGSFGIRNRGCDNRIPVFRPTRLSPTVPTPNITDSSSARMKWHSQFVPLGHPNWLTPPIGSVWARLVPRVGFFLHAAHAAVEVRRFCTGSSSEIGMGPGAKVRIDFEFENGSAPVALGASFPADGAVFQLRIPDNLYSVHGSHSEAKWRSLRTARFMDQAWRGDILGSVSSPFLREWLAEIFLTAITYEAMRSGADLPTAASKVSAGISGINLSSVLAALFQSNIFELDPGETERPAQDTLRQELDQLLQQAGVVSELFVAARLLWEPVSDEWESWLRDIYHCTVAASLIRSISDICPTIDTTGLAVDLDRGPAENDALAPCDPNMVEIWITEQSPGGSGLIEEFMRAYAEDPRRFFSVVRANLEMGEFELIDHQLTRLLGVLIDEETGSRSRELVGRFRASTSHADMTHVARELRLALLRDGFSPFHGFLVSLANRILRPGASPATDRYLSSAIQHWISTEARLGLEVDLRVISFWLSQSTDIDQLMSDIAMPNVPDIGTWRMNTIYGLLWARGRAIRQGALELRSQFADLPRVDRLLVIETLVDDREKVSVTSEHWLETAAVHLAAGRMVTLTCEEGTRHQLGEALNALITNPIETGCLRAYARLQGIRQTAALVEADIELVEAVQ
jgi:hypothetical protein